MLQPYIESATALSGDIDDEEIARISGFCRAAEMDFQLLAGPINVGVDLKYDVLYRYVFIESLLKSG